MQTYHVRWSVVTEWSRDVRWSVVTEWSRDVTSEELADALGMSVAEVEVEVEKNMDPDRLGVKKQRAQHRGTAAPQRATELLTKKDVAERLGVSVTTLDRCVRLGQISYLRIGGRVRFTEANIQAYLAASERTNRRPVRRRRTA